MYYTITWTFGVGRRLSAQVEIQYVGFLAARNSEYFKV